MEEEGDFNDSLGLTTDNLHTPALKPKAGGVQVLVRVGGGIGMRQGMLCMCMSILLKFTGS